jgi:hypothetical protein
VKPDGWWLKGVPDRLGRVPPNSGFTLFLGQGGEWKAVATLLRRRIRALSPMIRAGRKIGAEFELDVAVMLGGSSYVTRSARFGPRDLTLLADLGVELCVTAYPVSEPPRARTKRRRKLAALGAQSLIGPRLSGSSAGRPLTPHQPNAVGARATATPLASHPLAVALRGHFPLRVRCGGHDS